MKLYSLRSPRFPQRNPETRTPTERSGRSPRLTLSSPLADEVADEGSADVDMLRDTLAFQFGVLANRLLTRAFSDGETSERYELWLANENPEQATTEPAPHAQERRLELVCAGFKSNGTARMEARPREDEFLLQLKHPSFSATVSVAFSVISLDTLGVHLVTFEGLPMCALKWVRALCAAASNPARELLN